MSSQKLAIFCEQRGTAMVIALMLTAILSLLGASLLETGVTELKISRNQESATRSFFLAEAGLQHAAAVFNRQGEVAVQALVDIEHPLGDGSYRLAIEDMAVPGQSRIKVTATGVCQGSSRRLQAEFSRTLVDFRPAGAITILGGTPDLRHGETPVPTIDGRDHLLPEDFHCATTGCAGQLSEMPAVAGIHSSCPTSVIGEGLLGEPPQLIAPPAASLDSWRSLIQELVENAGTETAGIGTRQVPGITVIAGEQTLHGPADGAGILIVEDGAALRINGPFHFEGLVVVLDGGRLDCIGPTELFGAMVLMGDDVRFQFQSGFRLQFSREALALLGDWIPAPYYAGTRMANWRDLNFP